MSEFNLSDKIEQQGEITWDFKEGFIDVEDVKEAIKRIKQIKFLTIEQLNKIDDICGGKLF